MVTGRPGRDDGASSVPQTPPSRWWLQGPLGALALEAHHASEEAVAFHELSRVPLFGDAPALEHHNLVRIHDGTHAMRDYDDRLAGKQPLERLLYLGLVLYVQTCCGLIEEHHRRAL